jgi:fatty acid CoA ligase FadD9
MMLPHRHTRGVINTSDMFTRLVYSVIVTGIAPRSFYRQKDGGSTPGHYNAVPVDVVAASVVGATSVPADGDPGVNMSNYHVDDGCSLDAFVDWIESAGYPVERIDQYSEWYDRFQEKLEALPAEKKGASAFEVLGAYAVPHNPRADAAIVCDQYRDLVRRVVGDVPHLDETYIHKCLADLRFLGLVGDPQRA